MVSAKGQMDTCQVEDRFVLVFSCRVLMNAHVSVDDERDVMLQTACNKSTVLVMQRHGVYRHPSWW